MLKRLALGLVLGLAMGGIVAAAIFKGLGAVSFATDASGPFGSSFYAYAFAAVTGVLTGLVAGKPIWAKGGQIEAGLKAFFGALLAAGIMAAIRTWVHVDVDLTSIAPGMSGAVGDLPVALPIIGALLGAAYEADNTPEAEPEKKSGKAAAKGASAKSKVRVAKGESDVVEVDAPEAASKRTTRR